MSTKLECVGFQYRVLLTSISATSYNMLLPLLIFMTSSMIIVMLYMQSPEVVAGSTLLQVMDRFALNNHNTSHPVISDNIGISLY